MDAAVERVVLAREIVQWLLDHRGEREACVVLLRAAYDFTFADIARGLGVSRERARQLHERALVALRRRALTAHE